MAESKQKEKIVMDLRGMSLGRAASAVTAVLRGKIRSDFAPNRHPQTVVEIKNVDQLKISEKKMEQKKYKRYSCYPSGLKETKLGVLYPKNAKEVFIHAVRGMLANNKLRRDFIK